MSNRIQIHVRDDSAGPAPAKAPELTEDQIKAQVIDDLHTRLIAAIDAGKNEEELSREFNIELREARRISIKRHYDKGRGTIQDYARIYRLDVSEVNDILGQTDVNSIQMVGDLVDQEYVGNKSVVNEVGETYTVPFDIH